MKNVLIIGCGLLGSSLVRKISKKKIAKKIFIYEKSKSNITKIRKLRLPGIIVKSLIFKIIFLYSLIGVQKIIRSELTTHSFNDFKIIPGNFNFFILAIFDFDFS